MYAPRNDKFCMLNVQYVFILGGIFSQPGSATVKEL